MKKRYTDDREIWTSKSPSSLVYTDQKKSGFSRPDLRRVYLALALLLGLSYLQAQQPIGLIFRISAKEAKALYKQGQEPIPDTYFHTVVDSFGIRGYTPKAAQQNGHYLFVHAVEEHLSVELSSEHTHRVISLHNERDLMLRIIDEQGNTIKNARIQLGQRKVKYNPALECYQIPKRNGGGFLEVQLPTDTLFYTIDTRHGRSLISKRYRQFTYTPFGYYASSPIRWTRGLYYYFRGLIRWGRWKPRWRFGGGREPRSLHGYVVSNLPKYQPGDTLRLKAFVTNPKGRPLNQPLELKIRNNKRPKPFVDILLPPVTAGAFLLEWPLPDSIQLDQNYHISLEHPKRWRLNGLSHSFRYEAYQLDEVVYGLQTPQDTFRQGTPYSITASARDQNNLPVYDTRVKLHFLADQLLTFHEEEVLVKDTLWTYEGELAEAGQLELALPDSLFPSARMKVSVKAEFTNSNGELQEKQTSFYFSPIQHEIKMQLYGGNLMARYLRNEREEATQALLVQAKMVGETFALDSTFVELPLKMALADHVSSYRLYASGAYKSLNLSNSYGARSEVDFQATQVGDSLLLSLHNPHKIPVHWIVRHYGGTLTEGATRDSVWRQNLLAKKSNTYYLKYQFQWGGQAYTREQKVKRYRKLLQVSIAPPLQVAPGEQTEVKVSVKDFRGRPVKGVNVAAGAINAQFNSDAHYKPANIAYRKDVAPIAYNRLEPTIREDNWQLPIKQKWLRSLSLERSHYYRLLFPQKGVYLQYDTLMRDTFNRNIAQFAPFLVKNGKHVPIHLIYCNRKLVYYQGIPSSAPYSFQGIAGLNRITLRTNEEEITIDSILLKKGHKLEFSIDLLHWAKWDKRHRIQRRVMPTALTQEEKELIRSSIFVLDEVTHNSILVWDEGFNIYRHKRKYDPLNLGKALIGPFQKGSRLHYKELGGITSNFPFEPGFSYRISKNRERLYAFDLFPDKKHVLPTSIPSPPIGQLVHTQKILQDPKKEIAYMGFNRNWQKAAQKGHYHFRYRSNLRPLKAVVLQKGDTTLAVFRAAQRRLRNLPEGVYTLTLIRNDWSLHRRNIEVKAHSTLYQYLSQQDFLPDTTGWLSNIKLSFHTDPSSRPASSPQPWPYVGNPYLISGYVEDETGEPLIGASVLIKGTNKGTVTDLDGRYELQVNDPNATLIISYTGFENQELRANGRYSNVELTTSGVHLDEVVVTAYAVASGAQRPKMKAVGVIVEQNLNSDPEILTALLQGRMAGVQITETGTKIMIRGSRSSTVDGPLFVIDGKIGDPSKLHPSQIQSLTELKGEKAIALYGAQAANGIIVITTNLLLDLDLFNDNSTASSLRSNFKDYAYWEPNIITDKNGEASFKVKFPDNITAWKAYALGMDRRKRSGVGFAETRAFKPVIAQLAVPRFLLEEDKVDLIGKSSNYTPDSLQIKTRFLSSDSILSQQESWLSTGKVESTNIHAGMAGDTLAITYSLSILNSNYEDGERRKVPVLRKGTEETRGIFKILYQDTSLELSFTESMGPIDLYMEQDLLPQLLREIDYLKKYKYGCNEQTASKLMALCLEKALRKQLNEPFEEEGQIQKCISRLEQHQNEAGGWGWWNRSTSKSWITRHVIKALLMAKELGYSSRSLEIALRDLTRDAKTWPAHDVLSNLSILAQADQSFPYEESLSVLDTQSNSIGQQLEILRIKQLRGLPYELDSLYHYRKTTLFGSHYWGIPSYGFPGNDIRLTLLAHDILVRAGKVEEAQKARTFFVESRQTTGQRHNWRNTLETAIILQSILPSLLAEGRNVREKVQVQLSGQVEKRIDTFPYSLQLPESIGNLTLKKIGGNQLYITAYQTYWNKTPAKTDSIFAVSTYLQQEGTKVVQLEKAKKAELVVEVESSKRAGYLMLEVPIPASCSYASKPNGKRGVEVHREYDNHQTSIFIESLPPGKHQFKIPLEPRFSGEFTLNPAKIEQMYFPTFYGREGMKQVEVAEE